MLPLPEGIRLSLNEATRLNDADLLRRAHADILVSLAGPTQERVGRDILVLCAETAVKVRLQSYSFVHPLATLMAAVRSTHTFPVPASLETAPRDVDRDERSRAVLSRVIRAKVQRRRG